MQKTKFGLREMAKADLETVLAWRNSDAIRVNMYTHQLIDWETHQRWFESASQDPSVEHYMFEYDGEPAGVVSFSQISQDHKRAHWAFYSGRLDIRGLGSKMELLALQHAFENLKLEKLCCEVLDFNESVVKFHKKFGFVEEGRFMKHYWRDGEAHDIHLLAFFKEQWPAVKDKYWDKLCG